MKKFRGFFTTILFCILFIFCFTYKEDIVNFVMSSAVQNKEVTLPNDTEVNFNNYEFGFVKETNDFHVKDRQGILNVIYTVLNHGISDFTFYCDKSYDGCLDELENISRDQVLLSTINNFVSPYNSYERVYFKITTYGEVNMTTDKLYSDEEIREIESKIAEFETTNIKDNMNVRDKIKAFHDYLINNSVYDKERAKAIENGNDSENNNLNILFYNILWRARKWKGNNLYFESKDEILKEFQKNTHKNYGDDKIRYCYQINNLCDFYKNQNKLCVENSITDFSKNDNEKEYYFMLRQPIVEGINFFLYTDKYNAIHDYLFNANESNNKQFQYFYNLYNYVYKNNISNYFKYFFELLCVVYYDKFGENNFFKFALYCDYLIGNHRIIKKKIYKESIIKIIKDSSENIIDVIFMAFDTEDILSFIKDSIPEIDKNSEITDKGVIGQYRKSYINFINKISDDINIKWDIKIDLGNDLNKVDIINKIIERIETTDNI